MFEVTTHDRGKRGLRAVPIVTNGTDIPTEPIRIAEMIRNLNADRDRLQNEVERLTAENGNLRLERDSLERVNEQYIGEYLLLRKELFDKRKECQEKHVRICGLHGRQIGIYRIVTDFLRNHSERDAMDCAAEIEAIIALNEGPEWERPSDLSDVLWSYKAPEGRFE